MKRLIIIQTVAPDYRSVFFDYLYKSLGENFKLYAGEAYFQSSIVSFKSIKKQTIKNLFLFNRKLLFQRSIWHLILKNDVLVVELNPRIISNWVFLFTRKILMKEIYVWGHAWGRNGVKSKTEFVRNIMRKLSNGIIVYTNKQKDELKLRMPNKIILVASNSVIPSSKMKTNLEKLDLNNIIYVGRLVDPKKPLLLLKAFHLSIDCIDNKSKLIIVGTGDEFDNLKKYINSNNLEKRIILKGHISNYNELKKLYDSSIFSASPGYVGLSITQSFGFGVPMLVSKNENHSPEIEAFKNNINGVFFETDNVEDFSKRIIEVYKNKENWISKRNTIVKLCKKDYSIENMANTFIKLLD